MNTVIFLDIKKAFDTVNHDILLQKMKAYGISGPELEFSNSYSTSKTGYNTVALMAPHQASSQLAWCSTRLYPRSFIVSNLYE